MLDNGLRQEIVKMYEAGARTAEITAATGAARLTIYFVLKEENVVPSRRRHSRSSNVRSETGLTGSDHSRLLDWTLTRVTELEHENGALRERLRMGRIALEE